MNEEGDVTSLNLYSYCLKNEELATVLSYNTIETLSFKKLFIDWNIDDSDDWNVMMRFGCASLPTNYEVLNTLTNLKSLELIGVKNLDNNLMANIPKSVEHLEIGNTEFTQEMVDSLSEITNLKDLILLEPKISGELDFSKFENLKNLSLLEIYSDNGIQGNILKYCQSLKKLVIQGGNIDSVILDGISYMTELEELELSEVSFKGDGDFPSFENLKNLTKLDIYCSWSNSDSFPSSFLYLTGLKTLFIGNCKGTFSTPLDDSLNWGNLKNLEYIQIINTSPTLFDPKYLGDLSNLKEVHLNYNGYMEVAEITGNSSSLEVLDLSKNSIASLPKSISNLGKLEKLDLSNNNIISLPEEIGNLKNLKVLNLNNNNLQSLPEEIGNLEMLEQLEFRDNKLTSVPESISNLVNLKILYGSSNQIVNLPTDIGNLSKLDVLNFAENEIVEIPVSIGNLNITSLSLLRNYIEKIPDEIGNIKSLKTIGLNNNKITNIPSSLGNLTNLEILYLNDNLIDDYLPESLNDLPKLRTIALDQNIDIKGKSLTNPSIRTCYYYPPLKGHFYSLCESANASCKDYAGSLENCK